MKRKVVIVDDEKASIKLLQFELEKIGGVEITGTFQNGKKALDFIIHTEPDIVFLNVDLPGINGFELFEKIKEKDLSARIIFVSAIQHYAKKAFDLNATDYILKPVNSKRLEKSLSRI